MRLHGRTVYRHSDPKFQGAEREANYRISDLNHDSFQLEKLKSKYLELSANQRKKKRRRGDLNMGFKIETLSKTNGQYDCLPGVFANLSGTENLKTSVSENVIAQTQDLFKMSFKNKTPVSDSMKSTLLAEFNALDHHSSFRLVADESARDMEKLIQQNELGDYQQS